MTTRKRKDTPRLGRAMKELSTRKGSPCLECIVTASCTRSFISHSACREFAEFVQDIMDKAGRAGKSYEDQS